MRKYGIVLFFMVTLLVHSRGYAGDEKGKEDESALADDDNYSVRSDKTRKPLNLFDVEGSTGSGVEEISKSVLEKEDVRNSNRELKPKPRNKSLPQAEEGFLLFNAMVMFGDELIDTWFNGQRCCDALKPLNLKVVAKNTGGVEVNINGHKMTMFPGDRVAIPNSAIANKSTQVQHK